MKFHKGEVIYYYKDFEKRWLKGVIDSYDYYDGPRYYCFLKEWTLGKCKNSGVWVREEYLHRHSNFLSRIQEEPMLIVKFFTCALAVYILILIIVLVN